MLRTAWTLPPYSTYHCCKGKGHVSARREAEKMKITNQEMGMEIQSCPMPILVTPVPIMLLGPTDPRTEGQRGVRAWHPGSGCGCWVTV